MVLVTKSLQISVVLAGILLMSLPTAAGDDSALSDLQKKGVVYRMYADGKKDFPEVKDLSPQEVMERMNKGGLVLVDTRKPAEMQVSMLPGAITKKEFLVEPNRYKGLTVVSYCTISYRSGVFAREMAKEGIPLYNLKGGILAWTLEGGRVYDPQGRKTQRIHVFGKKWNYAPDGYQTVMFSLWEQLF